MNQLSHLLVLVVLVLSSSCGKNYQSFLARDPFFKEENIDLAKLQEHGSSYQRKGQDLEDISTFSPFKDETYEDYEARVVNTIQVQEYDIKELNRSIATIKNNIIHLDGQFASLQQQHSDLRLALSNPEKIEQDLQEPNRPIFQMYVVQPGDSLQKIAFQHYGTHKAWMAIYRFNLKALSFGPNSIEKGQRLMIPRISSSSVR